MLASFSLSQHEDRSPKLLASASPHHSRSLSGNPLSPLRRPVTRFGSTPELIGMTTVTNAPGLPDLGFKAESLSTIRDPRSPTDEFPSPQGSTTSSPHPDLNIEVATLSNKLISAINHQTHLDDALAATRQELESTQERLRRAEADNQEHARLVASGALVKKAEVEQQASKFLAKISEERKRRTSVEKDKKGIEQELENLTTALFEEANEMVATARKDRQVTERRNEQLRTQLKDMELLLASHQEQLAELKNVLQQSKVDRDDPDTTTTNGSTAPSTPALISQDETGRMVNTLQIAVSAANADDTPGPPTRFSNLLSPVLRTDLQSYEDFRSLLDIAKRSAPASRVNSGSYGGLHTPGLVTGQNLPSNSSTVVSSPQTSSIASAGNPSSGAASPSIPLKETKFYKRALAEDIEPTLRLDTAPGLSWLARRTVINSMCEGSLVVEPMPASTKMSVFSCSLCGENRKGSDFTRTHRFRTSESENAQRYPLCTYCLNRVRASCDYLGFLRMVKDGHWRTNGVQAEKSAWEESVRLRERMFWARIGGGVVPTSPTRESLRLSMEEARPRTSVDSPLMLNNRLSKENRTLSTSSTKGSPVRRESATSRARPSNGEDDDWETAKRAPIFDDASPSSTTLRTLESSPKPSPKESFSYTGLRESLKPRPRSRAASYEKERRADPECETGIVGFRRKEPSSLSNLQTVNDRRKEVTIPESFKI